MFAILKDSLVKLDELKFKQRMKNKNNLIQY